MKQDLRVIGAVALTSFIIVYICTIVLDKTYSYKLESNQDVATANKVGKVKKTSSEKKEIIEDIKNEEIVEEQETNQEVFKEEIIQENSEDKIPLGEQIVNFAIQYVGYLYVMGGNSLTNGTDCSGFVKLVFEHFEISLPRTPYGQSTSGSPVNIESRMPGDIVTYGYDGSVSHSALYIGEDRVVHAATSSQGIIYGNLYMMPIISIRRVI